MNRYFLKIDPLNECVGAFGQSRMVSRWEGGEIAFKSKGPKFAGKEKSQLAPEVQHEDELWIWTHEDKRGQGLVAKATAETADIVGEELRVILKDVVLVPSPFGFDKFKKRPNNGHYTDTRLLDYKSISRGTGAYLIEDDDYPRFLEIVKMLGGKLPVPSEADSPETENLSGGFSWADEIKSHKDAIISDLTERRLNWRKPRPVQKQFRDALLEKHDWQCVLTPCRVQEALEAAHVLPHNGAPVRDRPDNGLLLRRDLHSMFDVMLWSIDPDTSRVKLSKRLQDRSYSGLEDKVIDHGVAKDALRVHFSQFQKAEKDV